MGFGIATFFAQSWRGEVETTMGAEQQVLVVNVQMVMNMVMAIMELMMEITWQRWSASH